MIVTPDYLSALQPSPLRTVMSAEIVAVTAYLICLIPLYPIANLFPYTGECQNNPLQMSIQCQLFVCDLQCQLLVCNLQFQLVFCDVQFLLCIYVMYKNASFDALALQGKNLVDFTHIY